jgi:hypothetical protein
MLSAQGYAQQPLQALAHASASSQPPLGLGSQPYANLQAHPSAQRPAGPILSQSMDQSFMLDATSVINAIMQQQQFGGGTQSATASVPTTGGGLPNGAAGNPAASGF